MKKIALKRSYLQFFFNFFFFFYELPKKRGG